MLRSWEGKLKYWVGQIGRDQAASCNSEIL
jgi:hypothetical protein